MPVISAPLPTKCHPSSIIHHPSSMTESIRVGKNGLDINAKLGDSSVGGNLRMKKSKGNVLLKLYENAREQFDTS